MKAKSHQSLKYITCSDSVAASWCSLWDHALDHGTKGTKLLQILFSSLCQPLFSDRHCHLCENSIPANECSFDLLCECHISHCKENIVSILEEGGEKVLELAEAIYNHH